MEFDFSDERRATAEYRQRSATLNRASIIVSAQLDCSIDEAIEHMKDRAAIEAVTLENLAVDVVLRRFTTTPRQ